MNISLLANRALKLAETFQYNVTKQTATAQRRKQKKTYSEAENCETTNKEMYALFACRRLSLRRSLSHWML